MTGNETVTHVNGYHDTSSPGRFCGASGVRRDGLLVEHGHVLKFTYDTKFLDEPKAFRRDVIVRDLLHLTMPKHDKSFSTLHSSYRMECNSRSFSH